MSNSDSDGKELKDSKINREFSLLFCLQCDVIEYLFLNLNPSQTRILHVPLLP